MKKLDPSKPVQTKDGRPARIICTDRKGAAPIIALITDTGGESVRHYAADGKPVLPAWGPDADLTLVNVPEKHVRWLNAYRMTNGDAAISGIFRSRSDADARANCDARLACIRIEFEEGEGL